MSPICAVKLYALKRIDEPDHQPHLPLFAPHVFVKCPSIRKMDGRGGGDRKDDLTNKVCVLYALQLPTRANRNKRNKASSCAHKGISRQESPRRKFRWKSPTFREKQFDVIEAPRNGIEPITESVSLGAQNLRARRTARSELPRNY